MTHERTRLECLRCPVFLQVGDFSWRDSRIKKNNIRVYNNDQRQLARLAQSVERETLT